MNIVVVSKTNNKDKTEICLFFGGDVWFQKVILYIQ